MRWIFVAAVVAAYVCVVRSNVGAEPIVLKASSKIEKIACTTCRVITEVMSEVWGKNMTRDCIADALSFLCRKLNIEHYSVCSGITSQFKEEFLYVLGELVLKPSQLCGFLLPHCGTPVNPLGQNWTIALPGGKPAPATNPIVPSGGPTLRVLQLSDIHFDMLYQPGAEGDCAKPVCCREMNDDGTDGISEQVKKPAPFWGSLGACDAPYWTVENMLRHISMNENLDYILIAGDLMSHADWTYTREGHEAIIKNLTALLNKHFPDTPTFWTVGNHEGVPVNSFAPHSAPKKYWPTWLYSALNTAWKRWLPEKTKKDILYRASYSVQIIDKLRLISLNTAYCDQTNFWIYLNQTDPDGTLAWLVEELTSAERLGQKVQILGHIPPGSGECLEGWAKNYYRIVNRFESTIVGQFTGHTHTDSYTVYYEDMDNYKSRPTNVMYVAPSVTTFVGLNPSYRIYTIDGAHEGSTYEILDHETWFMNLTVANQIGHPHWKLLYRAKRAYNMKTLRPEEWSQLTNELKKSKKTFRKFLRYYARRKDYECNDQCRREILCSLRSGHHNDVGLCNDFNPSTENDYSNETKHYAAIRRELRKWNIKCPNI
uniref:Sphingomyelin phosphodiesterase n=1 Tax=Plectus sambesii TaxID=2011161 RepID=A0A914VR59_9BILA